jgi:UDPglucose--hexose-1-phosphate uridylyltransferase
MNQNFNSNSHRRFNILTGEWVLVSPYRTKRPWQGKVEEISTMVKHSYDESCYLCPGNTRWNGAINPDYKKTLSFTNDFSALIKDVPMEDVSNGLLIASSESGICKVICFSPNHSLTLPLMPVTAIADVISVWQKEYVELGAIEGINHVQIFENKGTIMGCSNPHPHSQIWSQYSIPKLVKKKQDKQAQYWELNNKSLWEDYVSQELDLDERVLFENEYFVALIPFWAVWPYETMILPKKKISYISELNERQRLSFAEIINSTTIKLDNIFSTSFPYYMGIHQAPTDGLAHPEWHMHMTFYPPLLRSVSLKKFMVGYEMFANAQRDITAEQTAITIKNLSETHYSLQ